MALRRDRLAVGALGEVDREHGRGVGRARAFAGGARELGAGSLPGEAGFGFGPGQRGCLEQLLQRADVRWALARLLLQAEQQGLLERGRDGAAKSSRRGLGLGMEVHAAHFDDGAALERRRPGEQEVADRAERVEVARGPDGGVVVRRGRGARR